MRKYTFRLFFLLLVAHSLSYAATEQTNPQFTLLNRTQIRRTEQQSQKDIEVLIKQLHAATNSPADVNQLIQRIQHHWINRPYLHNFANGESNWCSANTKQPYCDHIQQDPVYRTDAFNCTTYVQTALALIHASNLNQFKHTLVKISYGANNNSHVISFFNRNHFTSADFNPVNRHNRFIFDATSRGKLKKIARSITININHQAWFEKKASTTTLAKTVRVLTPQTGAAMIHYYKRTLAKQRFPIKTVSIDYIPKSQLIHRTSTGYRSNETLIQQLPTPAIVEIVRNYHDWNINSTNIKTLTGSAIAVSHLGLLYRQHFADNARIFTQITCNTNHHRSQCISHPQFCHQRTGCDRVMFSDATDAYPDSFYFYQDKNNHSHCTAHRPNSNTKTTTCNRVESIPLEAYLMRYNYHRFTVMDTPSILGIHLEKINRTNSTQRLEKLTKK